MEVCNPCEREEEQRGGAGRGGVEAGAVVVVSGNEEGREGRER